MLNLILTDAHAQDRGGDALGLLGRIDRLDPAGLATLARSNLGLDYRRPDGAHSLGRLFGRAADLSARNRYSRRRKDERFGRVFVEIHEARQRPYFDQ